MIDRGRFVSDTFEPDVISGGAVDEAGGVLDETGPLVNGTGALADEPGALVDETGALVDETGALIDETGAGVDETGACTAEALLAVTFAGWLEEKETGCDVALGCTDDESVFSASGGDVAPADTGGFSLVWRESWSWREISGGADTWREVIWRGESAVGVRSEAVAAEEGSANGVDALDDDDSWSPATCTPGTFMSEYVC